MSQVLPRPPTQSDDPIDQQAFAEWVLRTEADAVRALRVGPAFHEAVDLVLATSGGDRNGALVVSGLGKSGLIAQKLSATFASTGTSSLYLHPTDAMHGDLGRVRRGDAVLLLSYGGSTDEMVGLAAILRQDNIATIGMVGSPDCDLASLCRVVLTVGAVAEACPLNSAPTASTTAMMALGDALALCVMRRREFGIEQFRKFHPGGVLGRQLMPVSEAMRFRAGENLPLVDGALTIEQAYAQAQRVEGATGLRRAGALLIVDNDGCLAGIFTDGDLRRTLLEHGTVAFHHSVQQHMTPNPKTLAQNAVVRDAVHIVQQTRFDELPVVDEHKRPLGLIDVQDLMALKVIEG